jgi:sRNA-binding protein
MSATFYIPPSSKRKVDPTVGAVLELLAETFPACFSVYEVRRRPLKVGIHTDILKGLDGAVTS